MLADRLDDLLFREQVAMQGFYCCTHGAIAEGQDSETAVSKTIAVDDESLQRRCACAPPEPGLLLRAAFEHRIDLPGSWLIGASLDLVEAGNRAGCRTLLVDNGTETAWRLGRGRVPTRIAPDLHAAALLIEAEGGRRRPW
jgi:histidinol phosphatase-like enzyme